jgi:hypothetical protein
MAMGRKLLALTCLIVVVGCEETMVATETAELDVGLPNPAQAACMAAVADQTGEGNVTVLGSNTSLTGTTVTVGVGEDRAPWRCVASNDGAVEQVMSMMDEGAL